MQKRQINQMKIVSGQEKRQEEVQTNQHIDDVYYSNNLCIGLGRCLVRKQNSSNYYRCQKCLNNCQLVECINYDVCQQVHTEWEKSYSLGLCNKCLSNVGCKFIKGNFSNCEICFETQQLYKIKCGHEFCTQCLKMIFGLLENQSIISKRENTQVEIEEFKEQINTINKYATQSSCKCPLCRIDYKIRAEKIQQRFGVLIDQ